MKKCYYLILFICFWGKSLNAQLEVKGNLYGFLYDIPYLSTELFLNKKVGLEFGVGYKFKNSSEISYNKRSMFFVAAKRYLFASNHYEYDNTFVGLYFSNRVNYDIQNQTFRSSQKQSSIIFGGMIGRKWMYTQRIFMEANLGLGFTKSKYVRETSPDIIDLLNPIIKKNKVNPFLSFLIGYRFLR